MRDKEEEKLSCVSRYFDSYLVELGSFGCLGLIGLACATVMSKLSRGSNVYTSIMCVVVSGFALIWVAYAALDDSEELSYSQKRMWFGGMKKDLAVLLQNGFILVKWKPYICSMLGLEEDTVGQQHCLKKTLPSN